MLTLIFITSFTTVCLLAIGLTIRGESAIIRDRMESMRILLEQDMDMIVPELSSPFVDRVLRPWLIRIAALFSRFVPKNAISNIEARLNSAGNPWRLKPLEFIGLKAICVLMFVGMSVTLFILWDTTLLYKVPIAAILILIGFILPDALLNNTIGERRRQIRKSLADSLDLLVVCTEAGLGFDGAISKTVERMRGPLPDEYRRVLQDMSVGKTRMESLKAMADRVGVSELTTFVAAIHQADQLGVSIAHVLRVQAESLRTLRNLHARETAAKLPVKMLFPLVLFIFPAIFAVMLGPSFIEIYRALTSGMGP